MAARALAVVFTVALLAGLAAIAGPRGTAVSAGPAGAPLPAPGGLRFDAAVAAADRDAVAAAVASARPEARQLIDAVDGLVDLRVGPAHPGAAGTTAFDGERYLVVLDLATTVRRLGERGIARLVLHELGHVVDSAAVPPALAEQLDAAVPRGWGCEDGVTGACAPREERFAESFAKWATGDIGVGLSIGYEVPPPAPSPERWGEPLARLAAELSSRG